MRNEMLERDEATIHPFNLNIYPSSTIGWLQHLHKGRVFRFPSHINLALLFLLFCRKHFSFISLSARGCFHMRGFVQRASEIHLVNAPRRIRAFLEWNIIGKHVKIKSLLNLHTRFKHFIG